ncbi:MAG: GDP-L-fucose synthase [Gammaproteobacteria bacterium]|nr:GDP-L-fucose synthase [Gammaproteobacteria bacterium]
MKVFVAGHTGLVGSAIIRALKKEKCFSILTATRTQVDLTNQAHVQRFFEKEKPDVVFLAAAKVGGILANKTSPANFIYENLMIEANVIHAAYLSSVKRLIFLGSSCIYPKNCTQPIKEDYLLSGILEATNQSYAVAKIAGIELCHAYNQQYGVQYLPLMPTNLYGQNDNYNLETSHVLPAMIRKAHEAKMTGATDITLWGTGKVFREFLYVDDLADACLFFLKMTDERYNKLFSDFNHKPLFNIGTGKDITIDQLAHLVCETVGFDGAIKWDKSKPDGTPRKLLDVSRVNALGWFAKTDLNSGIEKTYAHFKCALSALLSIEVE